MSSKNTNPIPSNLGNDPEFVSALVDFTLQHLGLSSSHIEAKHLAHVKNAVGLFLNSYPEDD